MHWTRHVYGGMAEVRSTARAVYNQRSVRHELHCVVGQPRARTAQRAQHRCSAGCTANRSEAGRLYCVPCQTPPAARMSREERSKFFQTGLRVSFHNS